MIKHLRTIKDSYTFSDGDVELDLFNPDESMG